MGKKEIAAALRSGRAKSGMSVQEILTELKKYGIEISDKTLYNYETGYRQPNADTLLVLFGIYKINDVFGALGYSSHDQTLTVDETQLIDNYRKLSPEGKQYINTTMAIVAQTYASNNNAPYEKTSCVSSLPDLQAPQSQSDEIDYDAAREWLEQYKKRQEHTAQIAAFGEGATTREYTAEELENARKILEDMRKNQ